MALYFDYRSAASIESSQAATSILDHKAGTISGNARRVLIKLLTCSEHGRHFCNAHTFPASIHSRVLPRHVDLSQHETDAAISELISAKLLEGDDPHWGIIDRPSYYRLPRQPGDRRRQLPRRLRLSVLAAGMCKRCGRKDRLSVDHITPVARGGSDDPSNLQCLCLWCNCSKRDRFIG